jgi:hypothetical protein
MVVAFCGHDAEPELTSTSHGENTRLLRGDSIDGCPGKGGAVGADHRPGGIRKRSGALVRHPLTGQSIHDLLQTVQGRQERLVLSYSIDMSGNFASSQTPASRNG